MADKKGTKTKSGEKGFYQFPDLLDYFRPNAESKHNRKRAFYRYSPSEFRSPKTRSTPGSPRKRADREPRSSEGGLSPKKARRPVDHCPRHSDLEMRSEPCACGRTSRQSAKLAKKTRRISAVTSTERIIQSPSPPPVSNRREGIGKDDEKTIPARSGLPYTKSETRGACQNHPHREMEALTAVPTHDIVDGRLPEHRNSHERSGGYYDDLPFILFSLLLTAIITALLVGHITAVALKATTVNDGDVEDSEDSNKPFVLVGGGRSLPSSSEMAEERYATMHVCVYHGKQEGLKYEQDGMAYSAGTMPLDSCNLVLYCCAQIRDGYWPVQQTGDVGYFKKLWSVTANIQPWQHLALIVEPTLDDGLRRLMDIIKDRQAKQTFVSATASWCRHHGYTGVFLQWPHVEGFTRNEVLTAMVELQQLFAQRSLTLGTVVSQDEIEVNWMLLYKLAGALGEASIILKPPVYGRKQFARWTFSYYTHGLLENLNATAQRMGSAKRSLCFMAPAEAVAFTVSSYVVPENLEHIPALGPAMSTGHSPAGRRSYTEACSAIANMTARVSSHAVLAVGNGLWLSFTTPNSLGYFLKKVRTFGYTCGGIWDSERDDFAGVCDSEPYPLMAASKTLFFEPPGGVAVKQP